MNWYKRSQHEKNRLNSPDVYRRQPERLEEIYEYYHGEDEPRDISQDDAYERERIIEESVENNLRFERRRKIYNHEENIKRLQKELNDPIISEERKKKIRKEIGSHTSAISKIRSTVYKPRLPAEHKFDPYKVM